MVKQFAGRLRDVLMQFACLRTAALNLGPKYRALYARISPSYRPATIFLCVSVIFLSVLLHNMILCELFKLALLLPGRGIWDSVASFVNHDRVTLNTQKLSNPIEKI